jgi:hypothetical protein
MESQSRRASTSTLLVGTSRKSKKLKHISGTRVPTCHKKVLSGISYLLERVRKGEFRREWGGFGRFPGDFAHITDIAYAERKVFVADLLSVQTFRVDGSFLRQALPARCLCIGEKMLYVGEESRKSIVLCDLSGAVQNRFDVKTFPEAIGCLRNEVHILSLGSDGLVYVHGQDGTPLREFRIEPERNPLAPSEAGHGRCHSVRSFVRGSRVAQTGRPCARKV